MFASILQLPVQTIISNSHHLGRCDDICCEAESKIICSQAPGASKMWMFDPERPPCHTHSPCCNAPRCGNDQASVMSFFLCTIIATQTFCHAHAIFVLNCLHHICQIKRKIPDIDAVMCKLNNTAAADHIFRVLGVRPCPQTMGRLR